MYQINRDNLNRILEMSTFATDNVLNETVKGLLWNTIKELCDYNEQTLKQIAERVIRVENNPVVGEIVSALVLKDDIKNYIGLSEIGISSSNENIVFIDQDYEELRETVGDKGEEKVYEGIYHADGKMQSFYYKLKFYERYVREEYLILELAEYYRVDNPIVLSPFSKKVFRIIYINDMPEKVDYLDFQFEKNNLKIIENAELLWNLNVFRAEQMTYVEKIPYGNSIKYHFHIDKSKKGSNYFVLPDNNQTIIYDVTFSDKGTEIWTNHESENFTLIEWNPVDWNMPEIRKLLRNKEVFSNKIEKPWHSCKRIITMGDIEYALHPFRNNIGIECKIVERLEKIFIRYSAKYRNPMQNRISYKALKQVKVQFVGEVNYIGDYANYVLSYLEYYYPEIEWVGGR